MEFMLQNHVFPLFRSELGYMRARVSDHVLTSSLHSSVHWDLFHHMSDAGLLGAALLLRGQVQK